MLVLAPVTADHQSIADECRLIGVDVLFMNKLPPVTFCRPLAHGKGMGKGHMSCRVPCTSELGIDEVDVGDARMHQLARRGGASGDLW